MLSAAWCKSAELDWKLLGFVSADAILWFAEGSQQLFMAVVRLAVAQANML